MIGDVVFKIVRSDGQTMTIGDGTWRIPNDGLDGWASLSLSVSSTEIPSYDGAIVTSSRVNSKDRSVTATCDTSDKKEQRAKAISFFNPKYTYSVYATYMGRTRWTKGSLLGFKASEFNIYQPVQIDFTILSENPYLLSVSNFGKDIAESVGKFGFPWVSFLPVSQGSVPGTNTGWIASHHVFTQDVDIENDGDVSSAMKVIIRARGHVKNPSVKIGDGFVRMVLDMVEGDELVLDATGRPPTITFNGENYMNKLDRRSSILKMLIGVGTTTIEYDADDGEQLMSVSVYYNKQYLGV